MAPQSPGPSSRAEPSNLRVLPRPVSKGDPPAVRPVKRAAGNMPGTLTRFIGREHDVAHLEQLLQEGRLITITGPGGIGKTRLAMEAARESADRFPDGAWFIDLADIGDPDTLPHAVASAVSAKNDPASKHPGGVIEALREKNLLLVLDNCEHLIDKIAEFTERLLRECREVFVLATSREPLDIQGERLWRLAPMATPPAGEQPAAEGLDQYESVRLFVDRAGAVRPGFTLDDQAAPVVAEICRRLEGIPLAIQLAAARLKSLSPHQILAGLESRIAFLAGSGRTIVSRHKSLEAALDWTYDRLSPADQTLFRRLSIFAGAFTISAAQEVCSGKKVAHAQVPALVEALESKSLLVSDIRPDETRYRMLETVREYARLKLESSADKAALPGIHLAWCLDLAQRAESRLAGRDQLVWLGRLDEDYADLSAALQRALDARQAEQALRLAGSLARFWALRGRFQEGREWLRKALELVKASAGPVRGKALWGLGLLSGHLGAFEEARNAAEQSLDVYRESGDQQGRARSLSLLASLFLYRHPRRALSLAEEGAALARQAGDTWSLAQSLRTAGDAQMMLGATEAAGHSFEQCIEIGRRERDRSAEAAGLVGMGWVQIIGAQPLEAENSLNAALALAQELQDPIQMAEALMFLGDLGTARHDFPRAETSLSECLAIAGAIGSKLLTARSLGGLGRLSQAQGDNSQGARFFDQAIALAKQAGLPYVLIRNLHGRSSIYLQQGDIEGARGLLKEALEVAREIDDKQGMSVSLLQMGTIAHRQSDDERAGNLYHEALLLSEQAGDRYRFMRSLRALGDLAVSQGRPSVGVRLFGAAHSLKHADDGEKHSAATCNCERLEAESARHHLSEEEFETAWSQGLSMSMQEAVSYISRRRSTREERPVTGWASLTRAEREVIDLLKEGLTNAEIGERLYISDRTVGVHLSHIYSKLGLKSRKEVARQASLRSEPG